MERLIRHSPPLDRASYMFQKKTREFGVNSVSLHHVEKVDMAFKQLLELKSFKNILKDSHPNFMFGSYLIFSPHVRPEKSLVWLSGEGYDSENDINYGSLDELTKRGMDAFHSAHYCMWGCGGVYMWFDEKGELNIRQDSALYKFIDKSK